MEIILDFVHNLRFSLGLYVEVYSADEVNDSDGHPAMKNLCNIFPERKQVALDVADESEDCFLIVCW